MTAHVGHHHPGTGAAVTHPVTVAQQQQREREEREREARERDAREQRQRETENLGMREHHLVAAERLHRQAEARDHVAAQQRAAYYAATAPPTQQVIAERERELGRMKRFLSFSSLSWFRHFFPPLGYIIRALTSVLFSILFRAGVSTLERARQSRLPTTASALEDLEVVASREQSSRETAACGRAVAQLSAESGA